MSAFWESSPNSGKTAVFKYTVPTEFTVVPSFTIFSLAVFSVWFPFFWHKSLYSVCTWAFITNSLLSPASILEIVQSITTFPSLFSETCHVYP